MIKAIWTEEKPMTREQESAFNRIFVDGIVEFHTRLTLIAYIAGHLSDRLIKETR